MSDADAGLARLQAMQQNSAAQSQLYMACIQKVTDDLMPMMDQAGHGAAVNDTQYMQKLNEGMAACESRFGAQAANTAATPKPVPEKRLPMMIGPVGQPATYERFKDLGPVLVVKLAGGDRLTDASFVLFDPGWIAARPKALFAAPGMVSGGEEEPKKTIKF